MMEDKINGPIKTAGVNVEPFWPGLFAKALISTLGASFTARASGSAPAVELYQKEVLPPPSLLPQLKRRKQKQRKKKLRSVIWALVFLIKQTSFVTDLIKR